MKNFWLLPLLLLSSQAHAVIAQNCPAQDVELVQKDYDHASQLADAGLIPRGSLLKLDWALLDIKFCARQITLEHYCSAMKPALSQYIDAGGSPGRLGDFNDLARAIDKLIVLRESCLDSQ